jgi:hypothetical protein
MAARDEGTRDAYQKTLVRACVLAGGETELARKLGVPVGAVVNWLLGPDPVPTDAFLRAVDIVLTAHRKQVEDNATFLDRVRRRHRR